MKNDEVRRKPPRSRGGLFMVPFILCYEFSSYPRMLIEVFTRKNFGEEYFFLRKCLGLAIFLGALPYILWIASNGPSRDWMGRKTYAEIDPLVFWPTFTTGYLYLILFVIFSFKRYAETRKISMEKPKHESDYDGDINLAFYTFGRGKEIAKLKEGPLSEKEFKLNSSWLVECILEPAPFFILSVLLMLFHQSWWRILMPVSVIYSFSYIAAYWMSEKNAIKRRDNLFQQQFKRKQFQEAMNQAGVGGAGFDDFEPPKSNDDDVEELT